MRDEMLDLALAIIIFALAISIGYSMVTSAYKNTNEDAEIILEDKNTSKLDSTSYESMFGKNYYDIVDSESISKLMIVVQNPMMYGPKRLFIADKIYTIDGSIEDNLTTYVENCSESFCKLKYDIENGNILAISYEGSYNNYKNLLSRTSVETEIFKYETDMLKYDQIILDNSLTEYLNEIEVNDWVSKIKKASDLYLSKSIVKRGSTEYNVNVRYCTVLSDPVDTATGTTEGCYVLKAMYYLNKITE